MTTLNLLIVCATILAAAFMLLLALPHSKLRDFLLQLVGWSVAGLSTAYVLCPLDFLPDFIPVIGWVDDGAAAIAAIGGVVAALSAKASK